MTTVSPSISWTELAPHHAALEAVLRLGWSVFPLDEEKKPPKTGGVYPDGTPKRLSWKALQSRRPSEQEIYSWQTTYHPSAWAVITGSLSRLIILDFDGEAGEITRRGLGLDPHVRTGSGGHHVYFLHPGWFVPTLNSKSKKELGRRWPGLDIRADGGYAAFCGRNKYGPYLWLREPVPELVTLLPEELRVALGLLQAPREQQPQQPEPAEERRSADLAAALLRRALHQVTHEQMGRNDAGFWLACQLRDNDASEEAAYSIMQRYAGAVPTTNSKGLPEAYTEAEASASLKSAYAGKKRDAWTIQTSPSPALAPVSAAGGHGTRGPTAATATPEEPEQLPEIIVGDEQLRDLTDEAVAAIVQQERKNPTLFLQSARLVRVGRNEVHRPIVTQMGLVEVREVLTHAANFYRLKKVGGSEGEYLKIPCSPPKELAEQILARQTQRPYLPFPPLVAIVETPVIRPDGSILDQRGYDPHTQLYYAPQPGMERCLVPANPTEEELQAALSLIWGAIGEFAYVGAADRANALGLLLTPLVRPAIKRHVPLALLDAPKQGSGKSLFSDVVSITATGSSAAILTLSKNDEELQKAITSLLIEGCTIVTIDNIVGCLQSKHLDAVLTSDTWRGRILGQSKMAQVPHRATWIATGNNMRLGGDLARRCYRIRLDPKTSRPWMIGGYTHNDLPSWVMEHRAELISALLTMIRAWYAAGSPQDDTLPNLGTFTGWVKLVGGILRFAGVEGFLSNLEQLYAETDEDSTQWEGFLKIWHDTFGSEWVKIADIADLFQTDHVGGDDEDGGSSSPIGGSWDCEMLPEFLQMALKEHPKSFKIRLGKALEKRIDTCFGEENLRMERRRNGHNNISLWRVIGGSGGSVFSHARNEIADDALPKNESETDWNNSRHSPPPRPNKPAETRSRSGANPHRDAENGGNTPTIKTPLPPNDCQVPTSGNQRERFEL